MEPVRCANCQSLRRRVDHLQAENDRLRRQLDEALRAGKRQAGPFAKGEPKPNPKRPGRKPGKDYGTKAHRQPPPPEQINEVHEAPLPGAWGSGQTFKLRIADVVKVEREEWYDSHRWYLWDKAGRRYWLTGNYGNPAGQIIELIRETNLGCAEVHS